MFDINPQKLIFSLIFLSLAALLAACAPPTDAPKMPTPAALAFFNSPTPQFANPQALPPTFTPAAQQAQAISVGGNSAVYNRQPTNTPLPIPTNTPITNTPTPSPSPTITSTPTPTATPTNTPVPTNRPAIVLGSSINAVMVNRSVPASGSGLALHQYPKPRGDNGWGMHWIPTVSQNRETVDRFIVEVKNMRIKWVVFLNDNGNIGDNDYLVERLTANGIMPVMRIYRSNVTPYDGDMGAMVRHYRRKGVYYYQIYNEPNVNAENDQGAPDPEHYARLWSQAAKIVTANGGYPGFAALSPGGEYDHNLFFDRAMRAIIRNGDKSLFDKGWISVHNYNGLRPKSDTGGFFLYRRYNQIVKNHLGRSLPMIGTEAGSYHPDPEVEKGQIAWQYQYMSRRESYYFAFSYWLLASQLGGAADDSWEWQSLFRQNWTHPAVTDFFYR